MYKEVSLDPECFKEFEYYSLLKNSFGHDAGRYIIAPVKDWAQEAFKAAKESESISEIKRKSVKQFLNNLSKGKTEKFVLLPPDRDSIAYTDWASWQRLQNAKRPFCVNISEQIAGYYSSGDLDRENVNWNIPPTVTVEKKADDIFYKMKPLCRLSSKLLIIDQYFSLSNNLVLKKIFDFIDKDSSSAIEKLILVTSINTKNPQNIFDTEISIHYTKKPFFNVIVAPEKYFHDRYTISEHGSIKTGHGFSEKPPQGTQADRLSFNICGEQERKDTEGWLKKMIEEDKVISNDQLN